MFRKTLFWMHLCSGVIAGAVILMMSITGVLLTYERQIQVWEDGSYYSTPEPGQASLTVDEILRLANATEDFNATSIAISSDTTAPAVVRMGRSRIQHINPYTGEIYQPHSDSASAFFSTTRGIHRWFNISGDGRQSARNITGASNLLFGFLLLSGIYLWLPKIIGWASIKTRLWFNPLATTSAARDFNWHHVFGFWAAIPLLVIISTATIFNYTWAVNLVYQLAGEAPPVRGQTSNESEGDSLPEIQNSLAIDTLFSNAQEYGGNWNTLTLAIPTPTDSAATFTADEGDGGQPQKRHTLTLDRVTGETLSWVPFQSLTTGFKARRWMRYLHTGEAFGLLGQTIAGLASIAASLMVWTGIALALRRFNRWRARIRSARFAEEQPSKT